MTRAKKDQRLTFYQNFGCSGVAGFTSRTITAPLDVIKIRRQIGTPDSRYGILQVSSHMYQREGIKAFWKGNLIGCLRLLPFSAIQLGAYHKIRLRLMDEHGRLSPHTAMAAGSGAGLIATVVMYPTDTIKTRLIAQDLNNKQYKGIIDAAQLIFRHEGPGAFYKGLSASILGRSKYSPSPFCLVPSYIFSVFLSQDFQCYAVLLTGVVPYAAMTFSVYETLGHFYTRYNSHVSHHVAFFHGCIASAFAQTASFPCDTIKKKMQASSHVLPHNGGTDVKFVGMRHAFSRTVKKYGISSLWRGLLPNLLRVVPYTGTMFVVYEACKKVCLYSNGYTLSPFEDIPDPSVDQSLRPHELCLDSEDCDVSQMAMLQADED